MNIKGYKEVNYFELITWLREYRFFNKKSNTQIAVELGFRSSQTIVNALNYTEQGVKDCNLTKIMQYLGFDGIVIWQNGKRKYFIKNTIK